MLEACGAAMRAHMCDCKLNTIEGFSSKHTWEIDRKLGGRGSTCHRRGSVFRCCLVMSADTFFFSDLVSPLSTPTAEQFNNIAKSFSLLGSLLIVCTLGHPIQSFSRCLLHFELMSITVAIFKAPLSRKGTVVEMRSNC